MFSHARSFWFACLQTRPIIRPYLLLFEVPQFYLYISLCIVNIKRKHYVEPERLLLLLRNVSAVFCLLLFRELFAILFVDAPGRGVETSNYLKTKL